MAYVPQNAAAFQAAYAGAFSGSVGEGRAPSPNAVDNTTVQALAAQCFAFAQQLDTTRGAAVPTAAELAMLQQITQGVWAGRAGGGSIVPTDYLALVTNILHTITTGVNWLAAH